MNKPLEELYLEWLYRQVWRYTSGVPTRTFWSLFRLLHSTEFVWFVPNDDNRIEDGKELRNEFLMDRGIVAADQDWYDLGCSVFEVLLGISRRLAFESDKAARDWFWILLRNLGIERMDDTTTEWGEVEEIIECFVMRNYAYDGTGGLFPLKAPHRDQTEVELWYQMSAYLLEQN